MAFIDDFSIEELEEALEKKREQKLHLDKPVPLDNLDYSSIVKMCTDYIDEIEDCGYADEDFESYLYQATIQTIFGKEAFNWINKFF